MRLIRTSLEICIIRRIVFLHRCSSRQIKKKCCYRRSTGQKRIWLRGGKGTGSSTFKAGDTDNQRHGKRNRQRCPYGVSGGWWEYICSSWLRSRHLLSEENRFLYDKIKVSGGIISELMPGTDPQKMFFPMRNRIISGLSDIVVIVEAKREAVH